jgi:hypothetical protein
MFDPTGHEVVRMRQLDRMREAENERLARPLRTSWFAARALPGRSTRRRLRVLAASKGGEVVHAGRS